MASQCSLQKRPISLPINADDLEHSIFRREVSEIFDYPDSERGKKVFYEHAKGEDGPRSNIVEATIP
ncbi:hypothetical protein FACS1894172_00210 [Spirochaetia bacterium]|nr:hypothetical protein FACS1894164_06450 [Spirochaetia bacterium]GHU29330.1 hypothetical protein FACS1894172_00210 [Spirochaetia bacterium]